MSVAALIRRAKDLELISERQYKEFQIKLGRLGWRMIEPGTLTAEAPATLDAVLDTHIREHGYSTAELAQAAVMTETAFRRHYLHRQDDNPPRTRLRVVKP